MAAGDMYLLCKSEEFHLDSGQEASINLALKKVPPLPCTKVCGHVVRNCTQIQGATVEILGMDFSPVCHTETDSAGVFSFVNRLMPGNYQVIACAEHYLVSKSRFISLMPYVPLKIMIQLEPDRNTGNATVYGTVRNGANIPLPNTLVRIRGNEDTEFKVKKAKTSTDGEYLLADLKPGKYVISAMCNNYTLPQEVTVELLPGDIFCADLYLYRNISEEKGTISGVVLHEGHAVPYAVAALYGKESGGYDLVQIQHASSDGVYLFSNLKAGEYIVRAKPE